MRNRSIVSFLSIALIFLLSINLTETEIYRLANQNVILFYLVTLIYSLIIYVCKKLNSNSDNYLYYAFLFLLWISSSWLGDSIARIGVQVGMLTLALTSKAIPLSGFRTYRNFYLLFLAALLGSLVRTYKIDLDFILLKDCFLLTETKNVFSNFISLTSQVMWPTITFLEYVSIFLLPIFIGRNANSENIIKGIRLGIFLILPLAFIVLVSQIYFPTELSNLNRGEFWFAVGRYPSIFSDPNAFGIMSAIFIVFIIFFTSRRTLLVDLGATCLYFCISMYSGSRSFFLVLFLALVYLVFQKRIFILFHIKKILSLVFSILVFIFVFKDFLPPSLLRLYSTLNPASMREQLDSRIIYLKLGLEGVKQHPILGLGLGRFYFMQDKLADAADINLGHWRDNANNYYLQLATEGGIFALFFFLFGATLILKTKLGPMGSKVKVLISIILVSLIFGPHLNFIEFKVVFVFLLAILISENRSMNTSGSIFKPILLASFIYISAQFLVPAYNSNSRSIGFYPIESNVNSLNEVEYYRWSGSRGRICIQKNIEERPVTIEIYNGNPAQNININFGEEFSKTLNISPGEKLNLKLASDTEFFDFRVFNPWLPSKILESPDNRLLGLQFKWSNGKECLN